MRRSSSVAALIAARVSIGCTSNGTEHPPPVDRLYLLSSIRLEPVQGTLASGLDLDGADSVGASTACSDRLDHGSLRDPAEHGVDNALASAVPTFGEAFAEECPTELAPAECLQHVIARRIASGELLVAVEVRGIHSFVDDSEVEVTLHRAHVDGAPVLDASGEPTPGQTITVEPMITSIAGRIEDGALHASFDELVTIELIGPPAADLALPLRSMQLEAEITDVTLHEGVLAGGIDVAEVLATGTCWDVPCDALRDSLEGQGDLDPRPDDPTRCTRMSAALDIRAVEATAD